MTARSAERITGLFVRQITFGGRGKKYGLFETENPEESPMFACYHSSPKIALNSIVESNYRRVKMIVFTEQKYRCWHCWRIAELQADHIRPRSKGRWDDRTNLRGVCPEDHNRITSGEKLAPHPKMLETAIESGLRWMGNYDGPMIPCGWERI